MRDYKSAGSGTRTGRERRAPNYRNIGLILGIGALLAIVAVVVGLTLTGPETNETADPQDINTNEGAIPLTLPPAKSSPVGDASGVPGTLGATEAAD